MRRSSWTSAGKEGARLRKGESPSRPESSGTFPRARSFARPVRRRLEPVTKRQNSRWRRKRPQINLRSISLASTAVRIGGSLSSIRCRRWSERFSRRRPAGRAGRGRRVSPSPVGIGSPVCRGRGGHGRSAREFESRRPDHSNSRDGSRGRPPRRRAFRASTKPRLDEAVGRADRLRRQSRESRSRRSRDARTGRSLTTILQTSSRSTAKYPWTTRFLRPTTRDHSSSGVLALNSSGT